MFCQWYKKKNVICEERALKKRLSGGGRKPALGDIEDLLADEIIKLKNQGHKDFHLWPRQANDPRVWYEIDSK